MIDLYYRTTHNAHKVTMLLEEAALPYRIIPADICKSEYLAPGSLRIATSKCVPAIVDHHPRDGCLPLSLCGSDAILLYLADKIGSFIPHDMYGRLDALRWMFQPAYTDASEHGYHQDFLRLCAPLDKRLADRNFIADDYSIADIACYPRIAREHRRHELDDYPNLKRWLHAVGARPATQRAYARAQEIGDDMVRYAGHRSAGARPGQDATGGRHPVELEC